MELAAGAPHRFAGLGLMLAHPGFVITFDDCYESFRVPPESVDAEIDQRIQSVVSLRATQSDLRSTLRVESQCSSVRDSESRPEDSGDRQNYRLGESSDCCIRVQEPLPMHSGLGGGTQLACAVAVGLELIARRCDARSATTAHGGTDHGLSPAVWQPLSSLQPPLTARWLVRYAGRGLRSAVGLSGFLHGGLLLDRGYEEGFSSELPERPLTANSMRLPAGWRVVLILPSQEQRVHGRREVELIAELGKVPHGQSAQMLHLAQQICDLAQTGDDLRAFTDALDQYMERGARLFSGYQHGLYNGAEVTAAVELARAAGLLGVGQSSWGPTVFGFAESQTQANHLAEYVRGVRPDWRVTVTQPAATGAEVRWVR